MINLTEESGPSHDMRTESEARRLVVVVGEVAYLSLSHWGGAKNVVEGVLFL